MKFGKPFRKHQSLPDTLLTEAYRWQARLREPGLGETAQAGFRAWLAKDARHALAYEEAQRLWAALEHPAAEILAARPPGMPVNALITLH